MVGLFVVGLGFVFASPSQASAPANCKVWFDGCNTCNRSLVGSSLSCTKIACKGGDTAHPTCREYFSQPSAPNNCKTWFDGCNTCNRSVEGGLLSCTKIACKGGNIAEPSCKEYFTNTNNIPDNCKTWFDGCNTCNRDSEGDSSICTKKACKGGNTANPYCKEYFTNTEMNVDINGDQKITMIDALLLLKYVAGVTAKGWTGPINPGEGDADCDGDVDMIDALLTLKKAANLDMDKTKWCGSKNKDS